MPCVLCGFCLCALLGSFPGCGGVDLGEDMETRPDDNDDESYQGDQPYHSVGDEESSDPSQVQAIVHEPGLAPDVNPNSDPDSAY